MEVGFSTDYQRSPSDTPHKLIHNFNKMGKKAIEVRKDVKEVVEEVPKSVQYKAYKELIADYKKQSPVKYEQKKDALEARLASLK